MQAESSAVKNEQFNRPLLAAVAGGAFLSALGASVLNVSMPDIARTFQVDPAQASWYMLSFLLTVTVLLLPAGRLGDLLGYGRVYLAGFAVFGLGCLACAIAPTSELFIASRALAGLGSAFVMASSPALLTQATSPARRGTALGLMSTATYVGLTIGPPLGGEILRWGTWRLVFWGSLVASILVIVPSLRILPLGKPKTSSARFDFLGALIIGVGTLSFLLLCTRGPAWGLLHPATISAAAVALLLIPALFWAEGRHPAPTIDLRIFGNRVFSSATLSALLNYVALFISLYALPFALRNGQHMSPSDAGQILAAQALAMALFVGLSGVISDKIGSRGLASLGMGLLAIASVGLAHSWPTSSHLVPALWLFLAGAGTGIFISPNSSALMGSAPRDKQGVAGGVMGLARNLGMSLGIATASSLFAPVFRGSHDAHLWSPAADQAVSLSLYIGGGLALLASVVVLVGQRGTSAAVKG